MDNIKQLIYEGKLEEAIRQLDAYIAEHPEADEAWYLRGNAYRKTEDFQQALNSYLKAMEINPDSPAADAYQILTKILDYRNKEVYNP
ncbi:cytochrome c-type biogenesis protein CcmH/NrfG [Parabacteroides sp. PF5-5]|uniref:tetratricopeptide repeat protein n=1 Tax=unclassified Parabacteroides TaxID=2649774 RepID=UPI002474AA88|nr:MULTISPECIES: tetratricopeptide repeat protein [unclassified Parabacteroides]MDH6306466.1 cytochrome c-type biogenesis protein CcmH/NrfG [Parabacteroides sp. PH5-39]MDH6317382.1 cytochrome c-type biogenesis protein CcmH/NrfG [Parabacteroides sp. PF5-13]MDH6321177.1 cytochrome c-type biogenesis protein CcmH/NrfG [Parabacteroides sp. PH5-13]MDH6324909.1 cytochrome c-type biogenesis protein CcmH/NrfG [Parabacteroides sp. PH5-8]MDH6328567.1 cytochrome c-type biogenesis protein CcmH/NrfG [Paraba